MKIGTRIYTEGDRLIIANSQDCTAILEDAKRRHVEGHHGSADVKHAARIPDVVVLDYCNKNGVSFADFMADPVHIKRLVQHPDNSSFRIWKGNF